MLRRLIAALALALIPEVALAAPTLDGAAMGWPWLVPFAGILLSIAAGPLLFARFWHAHYGKIAAAWALLTLIPLALAYGANTATAAFIHAMLAEYLSFIVLLFALYVVAGGILIAGDVRGTPWLNTCVLAFGTLIASIVGTTGAAMILVRPLIRANASRAYNAHVVVFFTFLVANIGGALSPLGDPPLFVGFLHGVSFFWTTSNIFVETLTAAGIVLAVFLLLDVWLNRRGKTPRAPAMHAPLRIRGLINLPLIALIMAAILFSAAWKPEIAISAYGTDLALQNLVRDGALVIVALLSLWLTPAEHREANDFTWEPIREVAKLFAAIFVCIIPVLAMLEAGRSGLFAPLLDVVTAHDGRPHPFAYFWLTGLLSAVLDNAPTYLVFFELAGGDPAQLMGRFAGTLAAISMGAVFMGALTYIGNAPNFMIYAIANERGIKMPSFFGYMLWSGAVLLPVFALISAVFVARL